MSTDANGNPVGAIAVNTPHTQAILSAISSSNVETLSSLLAQTNSDPEAYPGSPSRQSMILRAAAGNHPRALSYLLQLSPSKDDVTPSLLQCCAKHIECHKVLIAAYPHALAFGFGHTASDVFAYAVLNEDLNFIRYIANEQSVNIDLNQSTVLHRPALEWAAHSSGTRVLRCLLTECAAGALRVQGTDAIRVTIKYKNSDNLRCLLDHAPEGRRAVVDGWPLKEDEYPWELERRREMGWDVPHLHYAVTVGNQDAVRILLEAGADPNLLDGSGRKADIGKLVPATRPPKKKSDEPLRCTLM